MPNTIVVLDKPVVTHGPPVHQLEFREPRWPEYMEIGEPFVWVPTGVDEMVRRVDDMPAILKYAERLIADGDKRGDPGLLDRLGLSDSRKVRDAIVSFFQGAAKDDAASPKSPTSSSSTSDGDRPTSTE